MEHASRSDGSRVLDLDLLEDCKRQQLNALKFDPCHVAGTPIPATFYKLSKERDDPLSSIFIRCRQINFVAENNEPAGLFE